MRVLNICRFYRKFAQNLQFDLKHILSNLANIQDSTKQERIDSLVKTGQDWSRLVKVNSIAKIGQTGHNTFIIQGWIKLVKVDL